MAKADKSIDNNNSIGRPKYNAQDYLYSVVWSEEDEAFIGRVLEFASLAAHGDTQEEALGEIRSAVEGALEDLDDSGERAPEPLSKRPFSGTLNLRMPKHLHRQLAEEAAQEGISLNQWINAKLAASQWRGLLPMKKGRRAG